MPKENTKAEVKNDVEVEVTTPAKPKAVKHTLVAKLRAIDPTDGAKVVMTYESEGTNPQDLLDNLEFPKGVNQLVNVQVTIGDKAFERALAPNRAREILEFKDVTLFNRYFR